MTFKKIFEGLRKDNELSVENKLDMVTNYYNKYKSLMENRIMDSNTFEIHINQLSEIEKEVNFYKKELGIKES
jgi:hypothetical protein